MRVRNRLLRFESLERRNLLTAVEIADVVASDATGPVTVPVEIDDASGVRAAEIRIAFDKSTVDVQPQDVSAGSVWQGKGVAIANVDQQAGQLVVFVFAAEGLDQRSGSLVDISFTIHARACMSPIAFDLMEVKLNEGQIEVTPTPQPGPDATDGLVTITHHDFQRRDRPGPVARNERPPLAPLTTPVNRLPLPQHRVHRSSFEIPVLRHSVVARRHSLMTSQPSLMPIAVDSLLAATGEWFLTPTA